MMKRDSGVTTFEAGITGNKKALLNAEKYIKENYQKNISLEELARVHNLSPIYFHKLFTSFFQKTPNKYLLDLRIAHAKTRLLEENCNLPDIALECGFSSQSYFCYKFKEQTGLYTDMTAIRRDDKVDETHSIYVDQWDWEKVISRKDRTIDYLKDTVRKIVQAIVKTSQCLDSKGLGVKLCEEVHFITSQELLDMYPDKTDKEREYLITKEYKTVFIIGIGDDLSDGKPHDMRAPDYDDWSLDGDLLFYHEVLDMALEISSMGIRVDRETLLKQLKKSQKQERLAYSYHQSIIFDELPLTIGGGIGQSRLCMLLLGRAHIGEVQASYWDEQTLSECKKLKIELL
jgi:aspartate--ammonia ligase